jgi:hypothetical protein
MAATHVTEVPEIMFSGRKIYIQSFGVLDNESLRIAKGLSNIMKDKFFSKKAVTEPKIITPMRQT